LKTAWISWNSFGRRGELQVLAALDVGLALRILSVGIRGDGNSFIRSAPAGFSRARA
jgi:hypothetical protein